MAKPRFTMIVLLIEDLARFLAFYRLLGVEFPADADERTDIGVDIGDGRTIIWTTTFERYDRERETPRGSCSSSSSQAITQSMPCSRS